MNEKESPKKRISLIVLAILSLACSFYLGRAWGFNEAKEAYEPVIEKAQGLINDLQSEIDDLYAYFEGASPSSKAKTDGLSM